MKKLVTSLILVGVILIGLMVVGEASAYTAMDFESKDECVETMGYETIGLSREIMNEFIKAGDEEGFYHYVIETVGLSEDEDMMVISAEDGGTWPAIGFVYNIEEKTLPKMQRTILRIYYLELI